MHKPILIVITVLLLKSVLNRFISEMNFYFPNVFTEMILSSLV